MQSRNQGDFCGLRKKNVCQQLKLIVSDGDKTIGFEKAMTFFAVTGTIFFIITFLSIKERIVPKPEQKSTVSEDLRDLINNMPCVVMLILTILVFIALSLKGGMYAYYFDNYLGEVHLATFLENIGFNGFIDGINNLVISMGMSGFEWPEEASASGFS